MDNIHLACMLCSRAFSREHKQEIVTCHRACQYSKPLHYYLIIFVLFCSVRMGVVAYERRIWCVALVWPNHCSFVSIALGLGSKNLANISLGGPQARPSISLHTSGVHMHIVADRRRPVQPHATRRIASETTCLGARLPAIIWTGRCSAPIRWRPYRQGRCRRHAHMLITQSRTYAFFLTVYPFELS